MCLDELGVGDGPGVVGCVGFLEIGEVYIVDERVCWAGFEEIG